MIVDLNPRMKERLAIDSKIEIRGLIGYHWI